MLISLVLHTQEAQDTVIFYSSAKASEEDGVFRGMKSTGRKSTSLPGSCRTPPLVLEDRNAFFWDPRWDLETG